MTTFKNSDDIQEQILIIIDQFESKLKANLWKMHEDILEKDLLILSKTQDKYGEGLLHSLLKRDWNVIPSIYDQIDPHTMSDLLQLHDKHAHKVAGSLKEVKARLRYLEQK